MTGHYRFRRWYWLSAVAVVLVSLNVNAAQAVSPGIMHGCVADESTGGPVVGALVTLYDAHSNLMIDYTFTDDKGGFHLSGETAITQMFIVVSSPKNAKRFNNLTWTGPALLVLPNPLRLLAWITDRLYSVFNISMGIVIGLLSSWLSKGLADRKAKRVAELGIRRELSLIIASKDRIVEATSKGAAAATINKEIEAISKSRTELERRLRPEEFYLFRNPNKSKAQWEQLNGLSDKIFALVSQEAGALINAFQFNYREKFGKLFDELESVKNDL